jgi:hypothetical protein
MQTKTNDLIQNTMDFWQKRTGRSVSVEDARQMIANVSGFFNLLAKWDKEEKDGKLRSF